MSKTIALPCFNCGKVTAFSERVGFRDECEHCHADSRVCKNCRFYDVKAYNECREPSAEVVLEKQRSNRCDFFQPKSDAAAAASSAEDLRKAAEELFKK